MSLAPTRRCWLLFIAMAALSCGGGGKEGPPPKAGEEAEAEPEPEVMLLGALSATPGLGRTAELTQLSDDELVAQEYLYIGTIACTPGEKAQAAILAAAGEHGGELVRPMTPDPLDILAMTGSCTVKVETEPEAEAEAEGDAEEAGEGDEAAAGEEMDGSDEGADESEGEAEAGEEGGGGTGGDGGDEGEAQGETAEGSGEGDGEAGEEEAEGGMGGAAADPCADGEPFPMLAAIWTKPGDAPEEVVAKWKAQDGVRRLHIAVAKQDLEAISELVGEGLDINAPDEIGRYALYRAALSGDDEYVAMIVGLGAAVNPPPIWGKTLLEAIVDIELRRYEDGNFKTFNYDAHKRTIEVIVGTGTDPTPALARAIKQGFCETADHLSGLGAEGDPCAKEAKEAEQTRQKNALGQAYRLALDEGRFDDVKALLKDGVDIGFSQPETPWELSPMEKAIKDASPEAVEFLLKKKVSHKFADRPEARGLLCAAALKGNKYLVQLLLKSDLNPTGTLQCAAISPDAKKMVALFISAKADIDGLNDDGETALYYLLKQSIAELKKKHEYEGTEPPAEPKGEYNSERDALDKTLNKIVGLLLKKGANPNLAPEGAPPMIEIAESHGLTKITAALKKAAKKKR